MDKLTKHVAVGAAIGIAVIALFEMRRKRAKNPQLSPAPSPCDNAIVYGPFRYTRTPTERIDGGMAELTFRQFQEYPTKVLDPGFGFYDRDPALLQPGLFVVNAATPEFDMLKVDIGAPSLDPNLVEEDIQP